MPKPVPHISQLAPCPLRKNAGSDNPMKHLIWRDPTGWVAAYGTPLMWTLKAAGLPCWHMAVDCITRWDRDPRNPDDRGGWISPSLRVNRPLSLPDGQTVCDVCWNDLTGGGR